MRLGDVRYTSNGEFNAVGIEFNASNDKYSCTWTPNPDSGQAYLIATVGLKVTFHNFSRNTTDAFKYHFSLM